MDTRGGHRALRGRAPGAGADEPSEHRARLRRGGDAGGPAVLRDGVRAGRSRSPSTATSTGSRIRERLELFVEVCEGVQHAHQKGIIHRDIKPSNVLVTTQDDEADRRRSSTSASPRPPRSGSPSTRVFTELGQLIGTPEYMSPEQAEMTNLDIDTRTDVYSLGVLLYELLAGELPFDCQGAARGRPRRDPADAAARTSRRGRAAASAASGRTSTVSATNRRVDVRGAGHARSRATSTGSR